MGEQIELVIIQNKNWCNSASAKFNYTLDDGTAQSLGCRFIIERQLNYGKVIQVETQPTYT